MSLIFSEEQEMIRDMAAKFAADKLAPHSEAWDRDSHFPVDVIRSTAELGFAGIYVPQTGIVDYKIVAKKLQESIKSMGGKVLVSEAVNKIQSIDNQIVIYTTKLQLKTDLLINCAGLYSDKIAAMAGLKLDVQIIPFRGEYWLLKPQKEYLVKDGDIMHFRFNV